MQISESKKSLQSIVLDWKNQDKSIGLVPTMGALHDGHLSLIKIAKTCADKVIVSIFVNPTQFAPGEDFDAYPRDLKRDKAALEKLGVDLVYFPQTEEIYPDGPKITVDAGKAGEGLDTNFRPHFFHGVATVVLELFRHVQPDCAVFGEKDYQQLMVIREMVEHEHMGIEIIGGPLIRDENGLALSSRNQYLSEDDYKIAIRLNQILSAVTRGEMTKEEAIKRILSAGFDKVDYMEERWGRILTAGWVGKTRLLDNMPLSPA